MLECRRAKSCATGRGQRRTRSCLALVGSLFFACYDATDRCDPGEVLFADSRCVCDQGLVQSDFGCVPCGENETATANGCVCADGFARVGAESACEQKPSGQGDACSNQTPCTTSAYSYCQAAAGSGGYCTSAGCGSSADCSSGYACDTSATPSFCKRPPVGAGKACANAADCAGTEATYCDAFVSHTCRVEGCTSSPDDCFAGTECCDLSRFGVPRPICVAEGMCP